MSTISKLKQSRNDWKEKAVERANLLRYLRKENNRLKKERDRYKKELLDTKKKPLKTELCKSISTLVLKEEVVYIALQLLSDG